MAFDGEGAVRSRRRSLHTGQLGRVRGARARRPPREARTRRGCRARRRDREDDLGTPALAGCAGLCHRRGRRRLHLDARRDSLRVRYARRGAALEQPGAGRDQLLPGCHREHARRRRRAAGRLGYGVDRVSHAVGRKAGAVPRERLLRDRAAAANGKRVVSVDCPPCMHEIWLCLGIRGACRNGLALRGLLDHDSRPSLPRENDLDAAGSQDRERQVYSSRKFPLL